MFFANLKLAKSELLLNLEEVNRVITGIGKTMYEVCSHSS